MSQFAGVVQQLERLTGVSGGEQRGLLPSLELFRHIQHHHRLAQAFMWGRGAELLTQSLQTQLCAVVEGNLRAMVVEKAAPSLSLAVLASFVAATFLILVRWWFDGAMRHSPEEIDQMFRALVMPAVTQIVHRH